MCGTPHLQPLGGDGIGPATELVVIDQLVAQQHDVLVHPVLHAQPGHRLRQPGHRQPPSPRSVIRTEDRELFGPNSSTQCPMQCFDAMFRCNVLRSGTWV